MKCPICKSEKVEDNASKCPECASDLTSFTLINDVSKQKSTLKISMLLFAALTLVTLGGWAYTYTQGKADAAVTEDVRMAPDKSVLDELEHAKEDLSAKDAEIAALTNKLAELHATIESSEADLIETDAAGTHTIHIVLKGESLWSISEFYHGHGFKHIHIADHNELRNANHIEPGDTLIIKN